MYQSTLYEDQLMRVRVDVEDLPAYWDFFRSYKEVWVLYYQLVTR